MLSSIQCPFFQGLNGGLGEKKDAEWTPDNVGLGCLNIHLALQLCGLVDDAWQRLEMPSML